MSAVQRGRAWGLIKFPAKFSESLKDRVDLGQSTSNASLDGAEIPVQLDMSSKYQKTYKFIIIIIFCLLKITMVCAH